jgi:spore germination protein GerM
MHERPKQPQKNRLSVGAIAGITIAALAIGGGASWFAYRTLTASKTPEQPAQTKTEIKIERSDKDQSQAAVTQVYWLVDNQGRMQLQSVSVSGKSASTKENLESAFQELLAGPKNSTEVTAIPEGTKLLSLSEEKDGVRVNLSQEFTTGGGSASMTGRLAQIVYTATSADPLTQVWIDVDGKPLELLGEGEGLVVDQPMTRELFEENFEL